MDFSFLSEYYMFFINGAKFTLIIAFFSVFLGVIGGTIFALMKISKSVILNMIASTYVEIIRGTPAFGSVIYYILWLAICWNTIA